MIESLTEKFKEHLSKRLVFCPDLAAIAVRQLCACLPDEIRKLLVADIYIALVEINHTAYRALVIDFFDDNPFAEANNLEKLEQICEITHQLTGLYFVAAIHKRQGVMAELNSESEPRYTLWSF